MRRATRQVSVPILMYHQVTPEPDPRFRKYALTPAQFARQMRVLALTGHHAISIDELLNHRIAQQPLPRRPVLITFDDGYEDTYRHAVPILREHGYTATFFLVAGLVGASTVWLQAERGLSLRLFDWDTARRLEAEGFACGSHSLTHPRLASLDAEAVQRELRESRRLLEEQLGHDVVDLAYPHGSYDERVIELAREAGYRSACSVRIGRSQPDDDLMALHRIPVGGHESLATFAWRLRMGLSPREWAQTRRGPGG
jgi:peptidoglycan/xylan/chitin deacetylase (PgdA/CDA1 family)